MYEPEIDKTKAEVVALELALEDACKEMSSKVGKAIDASHASIDATRHHMALVRALMENTESPQDEKKAWNEIFDAATKKNDLLKETDKVINEAKNALNNTIKSIGNVWFFVNLTFSFCMLGGVSKLLARFASNSQKI